MERNELIGAVTRAQSGDSDAIGELYNAFYQSVYYFAKKTVHDDDLALDITQETFMEVIRTIGSLKAPEAFSTWLRQITYHQCTRYFKKNKEVLFEEDEEGNSILDTIADESEGSVPEEVYEKAEFKEIILTMIDSLTPEQRAVVVLYYFDELPVKKIAEIQGVSEGTIKSRLNYARRALREGVETYEKKTGTKLHAIPFLPLFRLFLNTPAQMGEADAAAIGKAVSAAATGGALAAGAAGAAGTTATAAAATSATATAATAATATTAATAAVAGNAVAATTAAAVTIPLSVKIIAAIAAVAITFGAGTAISKKMSSPAETTAPEVEVTDTADETETPDLPESESIWFEVATDDELKFLESTSESSSPETEATTSSEFKTDAPVADETLEPESAEEPDETAESEMTIEPDETIDAETETAEAETEPANENTDDAIQYIPTCLRTHIKPTVSIEGDILTITNHTFEFDESNICFDDLTILIDGVDIYVNGLSERVDHNGPIVNYIRVEDSVSFSLAPYASAGNHTVIVKTACISADENHACDHWKEIGDVVVTLEYHKSGEPETDVAVEVPAEPPVEAPSGDDLPMGDLCTKTHVAPTLSIDVDMLTITNNTEGSDDFIILIDEVIVERLFAVSGSVTLDLSGYTSDGAHLVTVMSRCECDQIYYDAPNPTCDPFSSTSTIVYFYGGELPMGNPPCTFYHMPPELEIEGDILTITNYTFSPLDSTIIEPDKFYIYVDGELVTGPISVFDTPVNVNLTLYVHKEGMHTVTVVPRCLYRYNNGEVDALECDPFSCTAAIEYYCSGIVEEPAVDVPAEPPVEVVPEY